MRVIVTGGAGFIGSHIVDRLVDRGDQVVVIDNLSNGSIENIRRHINSNLVKLHILDLKSINPESDIFKDVDALFHYAANPEVRVSTISPEVHFNENIKATFNILEAVRRNDIKYLIFASSSTVYGDADKIPTPEDYHPLNPISVYGASKLSCEYLIIAYSKLYGIKSLILRYANIIGPRSNHGVIIDFINKLKHNPKVLEILGDGTQRKSYLYIDDAVDATIHLFNRINRISDYDIYNIGNKDWITVREIADIIVSEMKLKNVKYIFKPATKDGRGWLGDVKEMLLDISKISKTGWKPRLTSREAVRRTTREILNKASKSKL